MRVGRTILCIATAFALAGGCNGDKKDEGGASKAGDSAPSKKEAKEDPGDAKKAEDPAKDEPKGLAALDVSGYKDVATSYPSALDELLDLIPADTKGYMVTRDPGAIVRLFTMYVADQAKGVEPLAKLAGADGASKLNQVVKVAGSIAEEATKAAINLDKGMAFLPDAKAVIFGANDPEALPKVLKALGAKELPEHCAAVDGAEGYSVCSEEEAAVAKIKPGKKAAELRKALAAALPGVDLERANIAGRIDDGSKGLVAISVATPPGSVDIHVGTADVLGEVSGYLGKGAPAALGLSDPGGAFVWGRANTKALEPMLNDAPPPLGPVGKTFEGEVYVGGMKGAVPLVVLLGVTNTAPAAGLVAILSGFQKSLPKQLPDGTKLALTVDEVQAGGKAIQAAHAVLSDSPQVKQLVDMGLKPEGYGFAAGHYAALALGANEGAVKVVAEYKRTGATKEHLERLPPGLARALGSNSASWAVHLPVDGLQAPQLKAQMEGSIGLVPDKQRGGLSAKAFSEAVLAVIAPLSSMSLWMTHPEKERVLHVSFTSFGDGTTDKGKAAREAVAKVTAGGDRKEVYSELAGAHADPRFKARAGTDPTALTAATTSSLVLTGLATGWLTSFDAYQQAVGAVPPSR